MIHKRLNAFRNLNTEKLHTILDGLAYILGKHKANNLLLVCIGIQNAIVMIELIEFLGEFVAVVGNAAWTVILACLFYSCTEVIDFLNQVSFLLVQRHVCCE